MGKNFFSFGWLPVLLCLTAVPVSGQIALKVQTSQEKFLQYEPILVRISMRNQSGHPLAFGEHAALRGSLRFEIVSNSGAYVHPRPGTAPEVKGLILQPGARQSLTFDISRYYDLHKTDSYTVKAVIAHPQMKKEYESDKILFSVVRGMPVWESVVGVPKYLLDKTPDLIPTRQYRIVSYSTGKRFLYALVIEDKDRVYLVRKVGMNFGANLPPQCAVDDLSRLNLVMAASPKVFVFYQFDINGKLEKKEVRVRTDTAPRLVTNHDVGTVVLSGGRPARPDLDYEEIESLPFASNAIKGGKDKKPARGLLDENIPD